MRATHYISTSVLAIIFVFAGVAFPANSLAQSAENQCETPDFQITSDDQVYAITGQSFSYYVVTANDTPYQLSSALPAGLNFSGGQVIGTPQTAGDYTLEFSASNDCGVTTETVNLTVVDSSSAVAQDSGSQEAASNVGLNEIPDTGLEADSALTISFYVLALLAVAAWFTRRVYTPATVSSGKYGADDEDGSLSSVMRGSFIPKGQSIVSESVRPTQSRQSTPVEEEKTDPTQSQTTTRKFGDGIRRP